MLSLISGRLISNNAYICNESLLTEIKNHNLTPDILFYLLLFMVALLYASVGHGGASGYLALMAFFALSPDTMRPTALVLNIFVSGTSFFQYYRGGHFRWRLFWPFALASIPAAFLGGMVSIDAGLYKKILGVLLLFAIARLTGVGIFRENETEKPQNLFLSLVVGLVIGLFSGMIGIGGGIILSPVILLLHWADMKKTAAVSALFILVNSIAGISGMFTQGIQFNTAMATMVMVALAGGLTGSYMGARKMGNRMLRNILAAVLLLATVKLLLT